MLEAYIMWQDAQRLIQQESRQPHETRKKDKGILLPLFVLTSGQEGWIVELKNDYPVFIFMRFKTANPMPLIHVERIHLYLCLGTVAVGNQ